MEVAGGWASYIGARDFLLRCMRHRLKIEFESLSLFLLARTRCLSGLTCRNRITEYRRDDFDGMLPVSGRFDAIGLGTPQVVGQL